MGKLTALIKNKLMYKIVLSRESVRSFTRAVFSRALIHVYAINGRTDNFHKSFRVGRAIAETDLHAPRIYSDYWPRACMHPPVTHYRGF